MVRCVWRWRLDDGGCEWIDDGRVTEFSCRRSVYAEVGRGRWLGGERSGLNRLAREAEAGQLMKTRLASIPSMRMQNEWAYIGLWDGVGGICVIGG